MEKIKKIDLSVVIVNYNTKLLTKNCVLSVLKNTKGIELEIIVVDNGSKDPFLELSKPGNSNVRVIRNKKNLGFSGGNNIGIKKTKGRYVLLLNSDTLVKTNVLGEMVGWMDENPDIGIASCALRNKDGSLQGTGGYFPNLIRVLAWMTFEDIPGFEKLVKPFHPMRSKSFFKNETFYKKYSEVDWVTGAFLLTRQGVTSKIGLLDEDYFMYTEDTDFCYRAKSAGWKVIYNPKWSIIHFGGQSSSSEFSVLSEFSGVKTFFRKHKPAWQYPFLRLFLKLGALLRIVGLGILEGKDASKIYAKAFKLA